MRQALPYLLPLASLALIGILTGWEIARHRPPAPSVVRFYLEPSLAEGLEGTLRLGLWRAGWRGIPLGVELVDPGFCPSLSAIAVRLARAYPEAVVYRPVGSSRAPTGPGGTRPAAGRFFG